ncbi:short-chain dehydrogenase [Nocardioides gansuensis]|uniref:Short-chain dehydrogenase n=1 Tax=Nocardioides gansuensis TaxID=2138300 RepID=A0A2T8F7H8_9ACTN|nr:SDR family oxidoreductase [Nocardioides gansuensis]PVG81668.1 short-chain dehydrogenase [Nocardioides gansuensis]
MTPPPSDEDALAKRLAGQRILVTGAPGDLGRAICLEVARAGADVVVHHWQTPEAALRLSEQLTALGVDASVIEADVSDPDQVGEAIRHLEEEHGPLTGLVNNAGIMDEQPFLATTIQSWQKTLDVDLTGVFIVSQEVGGRMFGRGHGSIVNISSQLAFKGGMHVAAYCAAKAGVLGLTRAMARELGPQVRVNAVAPGPLETAMTAPYADEAWLAVRTGPLVTGRLGLPTEVAPAVVFLLAAESALFHGQTLHPNGGGVMA